MHGDPDLKEEAASAGFDLSEPAGLTRSKAAIIERQAVASIMQRSRC